MTYKPGQLAKATVRGVPDVTVMRTTGTSGADTLWLSAAHVGHARGHGASDVTDVRPLVVLDLADFDLRVIAASLRTMGFRVIADQIEAQTKPPRIPEPGMWGVVRAHIGHGGPWTLVHSDCGWICTEDGAIWSWNLLVNPELIREGVPS